MLIRDFVEAMWPYLLTLLGLAVILTTAAHILLKKKDTRSATGWLGLVWFSPLLGVVLYWFFGVNRIRRRAKTRYASRATVPLQEAGSVVSASQVEGLSCTAANGLAMLCRMTEKVTRQPLMRGNSLVPLVNGDQAYPLMLARIKAARHSISLCSYIFANDQWGNRFRTALKEAQDAGVEVRVLLDGVGARYSLPPITWRLRRDNIPVACFMQTMLPWRFQYLNLRNHRKFLVVDGRSGFTGGMNIQAGHVLEPPPGHPIADLHFQIEGPVVAQLQKIFAEDWAFTTGEKLTGERWFPPLAEVGEGLARGIADGPDEDFDQIRLVIMGALATARRSVQIVTPYFLPDTELLSALCVAALRGIDVQIVVPAQPNLRMVKWAAGVGLEEVLAAGCKVFMSPPPFDHSKLMVVDGAWVLLGSANWDARSLALNFEFNMECYDLELAGALQKICARKIGAAKPLLPAQAGAGNLLTLMRNRFCRLFLPYL
ncbi:MAG: phospholipase D-like domain-containing protein [Desulfurivibrionaceae bacterium]|nr:phospholipase D-like domain-containing protein [Desulfurivibrionaceae bacterium]